MSPKVAGLLSLFQICTLGVRLRCTGARADVGIAVSWVFFGRKRPLGAGLVGVAVIAVSFACSVSRTSLEHALIAWRLLLLSVVAVHLRRPMAISHVVFWYKVGWFILDIFFTVLCSVQFVYRLVTSNWEYRGPRAVAGVSLLGLHSGRYGEERRSVHPVSCRRSPPPGVLEVTMVVVGVFGVFGILEWSLLGSSWPAWVSWKRRHPRDLHRRRIIASTWRRVSARKTDKHR